PVPPSGDGRALPRRPGMVGVPVTAASAALLALGAIEPADYYRASTVAYGGSHFAVSALLALVASELAFGGTYREAGWDQRLCRLAMNYVPLVLLTVFGSLTWLVALHAVNTAAGRVSPEWGKVFLGSIGYDLWTIELVMMGVI